MKVKLVKKFADALNGIDLTKVRVGDTIDLMPYQGALLIAEGWGEQAPVLSLDFQVATQSKQRIA